MRMHSTLAADKPFIVERPALVTQDNFALGASLYQPKGRALGTVIVHSATATPSGYYRRFAEFLAHHGLRVLTYDYRGVGLSRPTSLRGFRASMSEWALYDAAAAHAFVRESFPGEPVATVGHSFGGQLIGLLDEARDDVRGTLLVASQLGYYGHWEGIDRIKLSVVWRALVPALTATLGYLPGKIGLGEDLPRGVAEEWGRWCTSPEYLMAFYPDARQRFAAFDKPILMYNFTDDEVAPRRAVEALARVFVGAELERHEIDPQAFGGQPIGHFGFFKSRFEHSLWLEAVRFFTRLFQQEESARASSVQEATRPPRASAQEQVIEAAEQGIVGMFQALRPHHLGGA
jgi:predicted alpha/beta hydrolase